MRTVLWSAAALTLLVVVACSPATTVVRVTDGDTFHVSVGGKEETVRLILIDTPETVAPSQPVGCYGAEASAYAKRLLPVGTRLTLEKDVSDRDRFGRLLRYAYLPDGRMVNEVLVAEGYARVATFPPDVKYQDRLLTAQRVAREAGKGLWGKCSPTSSGRAPTATATGTSPGACDPSYPGVCIPPPPPNLDCSQIAFKRFQVLAPDPHRFDSDGNGLGCES